MIKTWKALFDNEKFVRYLFVQMTSSEPTYLLLNQRGIAIPNPMSLIGIGGTWREGALTRRIPSVTVDEEALGQHAVRPLNLMREGKLALNDETEITMPLSLSEGMTLGEASILC